MNEEVFTRIDYSEANSIKGFYVVAMTDKYMVGVWPAIEYDDLLADEVQSKILELRIFNEDVEYKWFRGNIGESFKYRKLADCEVMDEYEEPIEEYQMLDIDLSKITGKHTTGLVRTSKGGDFYLPVAMEENGQMPYVKVKYYVPQYKKDDNSTVHAYVKDWRLAGFYV